MDALDGNAIAGTLFEHFGTEMTTASGTCGHCGTVSRVAELRVYAGGLGSVARCPGCGQVVLVLTEVRETVRIHHQAFQLPDLTG